VFESELNNPYVRAALDAIAYGEAISYNETHGGGSFSSFADHPFIAYASDHSNCRAAGRYQFCSFTWASLKSQYGFSDFSPQNQDRGAIALIRQAGALSNIKAGDWQGAAAKLNRIWPSLPGGSQQNRSLAQSLSYFNSALAVYSGGGATPAPSDNSTPAPIITTSGGSGDNSPVTVYGSTDDSTNGGGSSDGLIIGGLVLLAAYVFFG
jgi:muramidase (phage lysozyme)